MFLHFATRRTEKREEGPESIKCFCVLEKSQFIR